MYTGGLVVQSGRWDVLYPDQVGNGKYYIGEPGQDREKAGLAEIANPRGMAQWCAFLNPPWQALPFLPLAWMSFSRAHWVFVIISIFCTWVVAWAAGRSYELCAGRASRMAGVLTFVAGCSPLAYRSVRVGNLSPAVAFCIVVVVWDLLGKIRPGGFAGGIAAAWGALAKLATAALFPLAVIKRRWGMIAWALVLFLVDVLVTWHLAGAATFREFFGVIAPSLARSSINPGNKSLQGFFLRISGRSPLPALISDGIHLLQWGSLALVLYLVMWPRRQKRFWGEPGNVFAASVALVGWLLVFSPLCWEHYFLYLCPFWGWLIWEGMASRGRMVAAVAAVGMNWFPLPVLRSVHVPEPMNSYMLWGLIIMWVLAIGRLSKAEVA